MNLFLLAATAAPVFSGMPKFKDVPPVADTQVVAGQPSNNFGSATNLFVASASGGSFGDERSYLRFDLAGELPPGATLVSAELRLYNFRNDDDDLDVEVRGLADDSWIESTLTWNNQPALPGSTLGTGTLRRDREFLWYDFDVTGFVAAELAGDELASFVVKAVAEGDATFKSYGFNSREFSTDLTPRLRLEFQGTWPAAGGFKIIHTNDLHSRLTPHDLDLPAVDDQVGFERVGGAAYVASKVIELKTANPDALVLDAGDVSEGNPLGDLRGNGGTIDFYDTLNAELEALGGRGVDAVVVGNHDVRALSMVQNMTASDVPFISVNILPDGTATPYTTATPTYFQPYVVVQAGPVKVGVLGYSTDDSTYLGADTENVLDVAETVWSDSDPTTVDLSDWVNHLRTVENVDVVVLLSHIGHRRLNSTAEALLGDDGGVRPPEVVVSGHWHTWTSTAWQPSNLNYQTTNVEAASYGQYVGMVTLSATGRYVDSQKFPVRCSEITPNPAVQQLVQSLLTEYAASNPAYQLNEVVGFAGVDLQLDKDKWWTLAEFPWSGDNTAGEWVSDSMVWKANELGQSADLGLQSGGGIRRDVQRGPVTYLEIYETYPWQDDQMVRVQMSGQDVWDYIEGRFVGSSLSKGWLVTAQDGIIESILIDGQPIDTQATYDVVISEFMYLNDDWISESGSDFTFQSIDPTPEFLGISIRDSVVEYTAQFRGPQLALDGPGGGGGGGGAPEAGGTGGSGIVGQSTPVGRRRPEGRFLDVPGPRYVLDTEFAGGFRAVVTMTADAETEPYFEGVFIRLLEALPETVARREAYGLSDLVNADGSINPSAQFAETMLYRSHLGFPDGYLRVGDIIEVWGEGGFFAGNPQLVEQEGILESEREFNIVGHDPSLAQPTEHPNIASFFDEQNENHLVRFTATRVGPTSVMDSLGQTITVYREGGFFVVEELPGLNGTTLELVGVPTERHPNRRFRLREATDLGGGTPTLEIAPSDDAQVEQGNPNDNNGTFNSLYVQSASPGASGFGDERSWLKFDLSSIPAGATITQATLRLYQWRTTGQPANMDTAAHGSTDDSWSEGTLTWNNQPVFGAAEDTLTLQAGNADWYGWDVTSFITNEWAGDQTASFVLKPVTEDASPALTYAFDSKEWFDPALRPRLVIEYADPAPAGSTGGSVDRDSRELRPAGRAAELLSRDVVVPR